MIDVKQIQRWLNVAVRSVRLVFVILVGATLLQVPLDSRGPAIGLLVSGAVMLLLDLRVKPHLLSGGIGGRARYQVCGRGVDGCRRSYQAANVLERSRLVVGIFSCAGKVQTPHPVAIATLT